MQPNVEKWRLEAEDAEGEARDLVESTEDADDLVYLFMSENFHSAGRSLAAEKLLKLWEESCRVSYQHLVYVGDHAEEPYKSQANEIIRNRPY